MNYSKVGIYGRAARRLAASLAHIDTHIHMHATYIHMNAYEFQQGGYLWTCGENEEGQLGHSLKTSSTYNLPKRVENLSGCRITACSGKQMHL